MAEKIKNWATGIFIVAVVILTFISILGVWEVLDDDVIGKSLATGGILLFSCVVSIIAASVIEHKNHDTISSNTQ